MNETIYFIEDDTSIHTLLKATLELHGYQAEGFLNGVDFFEAMAKRRPELIIVDLMLPLLSGEQIIKRLNGDANYANIPIIILSALSDEMTVVNGIDAGAIDFVVKPFRVNEFISRVKSAIRIGAGIRDDSAILTAGEIQIDKSKVSCVVNGEHIPLTLKEFKLLTVLVQNKGKVVTRADLLKLIWGFQIEVETRTIDMHIKSLREKLAKVTDKQYVVTVRSVGYMLNCED